MEISDNSLTDLTTAALIEITE